MEQVYPPAFIYGLIDPRDRALRYIGKSNNPKKRLHRHLIDARLARYHRECWLKGLLDAGLRPELIILEECPQDIWKEREQYWIAHYRERGADLVNRTDGGDTNPVLSPEVKARVAEIISRTHKGKKKSPEHCRNISAGLKGQIIPPEARAKMSAAAKGRKMSPEARAKMSAVRTGKKMPRAGVEQSAQSRSKSYLLLSPSGERIAIKGLAKFCRESSIKSQANLAAQSKKGLRSEGWFIVSEQYPEPRPTHQGRKL